jgi:hypothetical protein
MVSFILCEILYEFLSDKYSLVSKASTRAIGLVV